MNASVLIANAVQGKNAYMIAAGLKELKIQKVNKMDLETIRVLDERSKVKAKRMDAKEYIMIGALYIIMAIFGFGLALIGLAHGATILQQASLNYTHAMNSSNWNLTVLKTALKASTNYNSAQIGQLAFVLLAFVAMAFAFFGLYEIMIGFDKHKEWRKLKAEFLEKHPDFDDDGFVKPKKV